MTWEVEYTDEFASAGRDRWYDEFVPLADKLYDEHLNQLRKEGLIP
jgi:hypothetical protein